MFNIDIQENATQEQQKSTKRMPFKPEEDDKLRELVQKHGDTNWKLISSLMPNRSVRQCRERWNNNLCSKVIKDKWSSQEDELLKIKFYEFGPKWKLLEKFFPGRTSYNIRNRWNCIVRLWNIYSSSALNQNSKNKTIPHNLNPIVNQNQNQTKKHINIIENKQETKKYEMKSKDDDDDEIINFHEDIDDSLEFDELFFQEIQFDCF